MTYPVLPAVECAILHDEFQPVDGQMIFEAVQRLAVELKFAAEVQLMITSTDKDIHVHAGGHRILISQNAEPLGMDGFRNALTTPYTGFVLPNATEIVQRHKANTFVTIAKGLIPHSEEFSKLLGDEFDALKAMDHFSTFDEAQRAMVFCRELTKLIVSHHQATAIHWCTSDNLVPQAFFEHACERSDFALLGARPYLSSSAGRMAEGLPIGAAFNGSQWLIGKMIMFEEAVVPFPWMMEVVMGFINLCQIRGSIIPHNETFSVEGQDWTIAVMHEPAIEGTDWEFVRLIVVNAPEFGIHGDTTAKQTIEYQDEDDIRARVEVEKREVRAANDVILEEPNTLDPEDDFDSAILEKLRKKQAVEQRQETSAEVSNFQPEPQEAWEQPRKRTDLDALRELARQGLEETSDKSEKPSPSLMSRMAGMFSRK